jgi:Ca2+-binding EF-hand superfamily protein
MKVFQIAIAFGLMLLVTTPVIAQEGRRERPRMAGEQQDGPGQRGNRERRPERVNPLMMALDADKNGTLSAAEIAAAATALKTLDKNSDGSIQPDELRPPRNREGRPPVRSEQPERSAERPAGGGTNAFVDRIMAQDADKDGKVSKEEAGERMASFFGNMDSDNDGFLTKPELEAMAKRFQRGGGNRGGGNRGARGGGQQPKSKDNRPAFDDD